ncbi:MAG TPA: NIL domain-containing protein [Taishania sp.]|nr:NIL domain-containing protein [Taishania sp.]
MLLPESILNSLEKEYKAGYYPLIELKLEGNVHFKQLIETIQSYYNTPYTIIKLKLEYIGKANFGGLLILLKGSADQNELVLRYFKQSNIENKVLGYAA